jgi:hypothetical protein
MTCGDKGWKTAAGAPCGQDIPEDAPGCIWHNPNLTAQQRSAIAAAGGRTVARHGSLPETYRVSFKNRNEVIAFAEDIARRAMVENIDPKRITQALRAASLALDAHAQAQQEQLTKALLQLEHGGASVALLARLTEGFANMRPLTDGTGAPVPLATNGSGKIIDVTPTDEGAEGDAQAIAAVTEQLAKVKGPIRKPKFKRGVPPEIAAILLGVPASAQGADEDDDDSEDDIPTEFLTAKQAREASKRNE